MFFGREKYMIEFIKKYRSAPERTVITFKCSKRMCINKLGELERAGYDAMMVDSCEVYDKKRGKRSERREEKNADKWNDGVLPDVASGQARECECGCDDSLKISLKGGICSEKSARILLCDLIVGTMATVALMSLAKMLKVMIK